MTLSGIRIGIGIGRTAMNQSNDRPRIGVLFGGRSAEHDVSIMSATNVLAALSPERYDIVPIYITRDGRWLLSKIVDGVASQPESGEELCLLAGGKGRMLALECGGSTRELPALDALFPVLHGLFGEDGSVQGLATVARVALVGCGILGSAVALDKRVTKQLLFAGGIPIAKSLTILPRKVPSFIDLTNALGLPIFIKPARQGSSVGVAKVSTASDYETAIASGFGHDSVLLAEEFIDGREVECSVIEGTTGNLFVSRPGEIVPASHHSFYSYEAKYIDADGALIKVPADLPHDTESKIRDLAGKAFHALGCDSMARVDFFVTSDFRIIVNEVNTIPGFTDISMYAKAMSASGVSYPEVLDRLIEHGLARADRESTHIKSA